MFLTEGNTLLYLVQKGFASLEDAVSGAFTVRPLSRRNRNFWVHSANRHYFLKQVAKWNTASRSALDAEASLYKQSRVDERFAFLQGMVPDCYSYDPDWSVLILAFLPSHAALHDSKRRFDRATAERIGHMVGTFHSKTAAPELKQIYPPEMPWFFSLHKSSEESMDRPSGGRRELIRTVHRHRDFARALESASSTWQPRCLMHADCKLENWLVDESGSLKLIDWECIGWGDPAWDVATLLQSYWNFHVRYPHIHTAEKIRPALRAFLAGYVRQQRLSSGDFILRVVSVAGVRMLQTAFETVENSDSLTPPAVRLLQAALNIISRPEWAASYFLGEQWQSSLLN